MKPDTEFPYAARIVAPRLVEDSQEDAVGVFAPLSSSEISFDVCIDGESTSWWVRAAHEPALQRTLTLLRAAYPDAEVFVDPDAYDPADVREWEEMAVVGLHPAGDPALPLRGVWRDSLSRREADPLEGIVAQARVSGGLRVVARLRARAADESTTRALQHRADDPIARRDAERTAQRAAQPTGKGSGELPFVPVIIGAVALVGGYQLWQWYQAAAWWQLAGVLLAVVTLAGLAGLLWAKTGKLLSHVWSRSPPPLPEDAVTQKLAYPLLVATIEVRVIAPPSPNRESLADVALRVAAAYQEFFGGGVSGGTLVPGSAKHRDSRSPAAEDPEITSREHVATLCHEIFDVVVSGGRRVACFATRRDPNAPAGKALTLNARECAALWHLPARMASGSGVERAHSKRLLPAPEQDLSGILIGQSDVNQSLPIRMPMAIATRNHLVVAKTRRGKSTLLRHISAGIMEHAVNARRQSEEPALIVLDPHHDLAVDVLRSVPPQLADRVTHLNFANPDLPLGLNLLDVTTFRERDLAVENLITIMHRLWPDAWGARMEGALRNTLLLLYERNLQVVAADPVEGPDRQHTILDVPAVLTEDELRRDLLAQVESPRLNAWWQSNFESAGQQLKHQIANPGANKIGHFISNVHAERLFGQPRTTFDPRRTIEDGGVLIIDTPIGALGEGAAAMLGATMMNLVGIAIEGQINLPPERRRPVVGIIDESSTLGAINFHRMLSELGKYGGSFVLVTQSLTKLDEISEGLANVILANIDGLTVFQTSAEDAERLIPELGEEHLTVSDLVAVDDYHAYARWMSRHGKPPPFSVGINPPPDDLAAADEQSLRITESSARRFGRPRKQVEATLNAAYQSQLAYGGKSGKDGRALAQDVRDGVEGGGGRERPPNKKKPEPDANPMTMLDPNN